MMSVYCWDNHSVCTVNMLGTNINKWIENRLKQNVAIENGCMYVCTYWKKSQIQ